MFLNVHRACTDHLKTFLPWPQEYQNLDLDIWALLKIFEISNVIFEMLLLNMSYQWGKSSTVL